MRANRKLNPKRRHFGMDAEIQRPRQHRGTTYALETTDGKQRVDKSPESGMHFPMVTVHGLDIGIHADMTVFSSFARSLAHRYTQVLKTCHSGMDRRNPDYRDVNLRVGTLP